MRSYLQSNGFLPIENWNVFQIIHSTKTPSRAQRKEIKTLIESHVRNLPGLYAYKDKHGSLLYVGLAQVLFDRILDHYSEAYKEVNASKKGAAWIRFFSDHVGELNVYWIELYGDREQKIIEEMIECVLGTQFDKEYPRGQRKIKGF